MTTPRTQVIYEAKKSSTTIIGSTNINDFYKYEITDKAAEFVEQCKQLNDQLPSCYPEDLFSSHQGYMDPLIALQYVQRSRISKDKKYNCVKITHCQTTEYNPYYIEERSIAIERHPDSFLGIKISCMDPSELTAVNLYVQQSKPSKHNPLVRYMRIENPTSSYVRFFDFPLLCGHPILSWRIGIETNSLFSESQHPVQLDYLLCDGDLRRKQVCIYQGCSDASDSLSKGSVDLYDEVIKYYQK